MEEKTIEKTVYIAKDGKEFFDKKECKEYEKEVLDKIQYYSISYPTARQNPVRLPFPGKDRDSLLQIVDRSGNQALLS